MTQKTGHQINETVRYDFPNFYFFHFPRETGKTKESHSKIRHKLELYKITYLKYLRTYVSEKP